MVNLAKMAVEGKGIEEVHISDVDMPGLYY